MAMMIPVAPTQTGAKYRSSGREPRDGNRSLAEDIQAAGKGSLRDDVAIPCNRL